MNAVKALLQKIAVEPGVDGAADRRERHRQGSRGEGHSLQQQPREPAVHEHHLLGAARERCSKASCSATSAAPSPAPIGRSAACSKSADGGTVFLDEIGEMVPALQAKLLRFLEEKTFKRVGGSTDIHVDVRVIAATNRNLEDEVRAGTFREDLFYRLNVLPIVLPPLRERAEDIPLLVDVLRRRLQRRVQEAGARGHAEAMKRLASLRLARQHPRAAERGRARDAAGRRRRR